MKRGLLLLGCVLSALAVCGPAIAAAPGPVELVVTLDAPPLARAVASSRALTQGAKRQRLDLRTPSSVSYLRGLAASQRALEARITRAIPGARVRWRYGVVLNGLAVVVPVGAAERLAAVPGVAGVFPSVRYRARLDRTPGQIAAPALWGSDFSTAGAGIKIGIVDDGVDQTHPFFSARGFAFPAGFPKGDAAFTTAKVIAARAFPPAAPAWRHGAKPFDPELSEHGTHVAGIAAGNNAVAVDGGRTSVTGVAPRAYLGNYKVLTIPTASGVGLDGNSPEIAAGIEAAVRDGMDVINLSLGEPEIEPTRDLVVAAINAAADAGVVPVVAAGNDFNDFGRGSVGSPGTAAKAITVAAATSGRGGGGAGIVAGFSSSGPTPISLQLKPDVTAPGGEILSSVPAREGLWAVFSGTSMAAPHVAGSAALLRQRHPAWTVAHVKSALVLTGTRALADGSGVAEAAPLREGGGLVNLLRANDPLVLATPASLSFGLLRRGATATRTVDLTDAGGGAGAWAVSYEARDPGADLTLPATVTVPGRIEVRATVPSGAQDADVQGFVVLTRGAEQRRIPLWLHASVPSLGRHRTTALARTGIYRGNTAGRPALVGRYRYPEDPSGADVAAQLDGPEQVFRVRIGRPVQNFGVAVLSSAKNVRVQARIVVAGDENRQVGYTSLPINLNPYLPDFLEPRPVSGALRPAPGRYDIVFDSPTRAQAGRFRFRFWIDDTKPPALRFVARAVGMNAPLHVAVTDAGSGVDPESIRATVDGRATIARLAGARIRISTDGLSRGRHLLVLQVSDYQETRNNENVLRILPNTRRVVAAFTIR